MKGVTLIICVFSLAIVVHGLTDEQKHRLRDFHQECQADPATYIDPDQLKKAAENGETVPGLAAHSLCISKKIGFQNSNGDVDSAVLRNRISRVVSDQAKIDNAVGKCSQPKATPGETAIYILKCIRDNVGDFHNAHHHHH